MNDLEFETNNYWESMSFEYRCKVFGSETYVSKDLSGDMFLDEITTVVADFLRSCGFTYITEVVIHTQGGSSISSEDM